MEFNKRFLDKFIEVAIERHKIYKLRESGAPRPWTNNEILRDYFFCNLFRQYDKCSKWIIENIVPYQRWDLLVLYRFISTYDTFEKIKANCKLDDLERIHGFLAEIKQSGEKIFSGCFIRNPRIPGGWTETYNVPFVLIDEIKKDGTIELVIALNSLEKMVEYFSRFSGTKFFMGYEYACDLEYAQFFNPTDKLTWANMGPGAMRGMSLLLHGSAFQKMKQDFWLAKAQELLGIMTKEVGSVFPEETITMREVEHQLCEFQKYVKYCSMSEGSERVKHRKFNGSIEV